MTTYAVSQEPFERAGDVWWLPSGSQIGGPGGPQVVVRPEQGPAWTGVFAAEGNHPGPSTLVPLAGGEHFALATTGALYVVDPRDPAATQEIGSGCTRSLVAVAAAGLVLAVDFTNLTALGRDGLAWESERLVWDDLEVIAVEGTVVHCRGFHPPSDGTMDVNVDLVSGAVVRGAERRATWW